MAGHSRSSVSPESWQDDVDSSQRPPTSSTSDFSEHSFHSRSKSSAHVSSPKRLSMFSRSRSNTTNLASLTNRQLPSVPLSYGEPSVSPVPSDEKASDNVARSLLVRGSRILRRQGSKLNVAAALDEEEDLGKGAAARFEVSNIFHRVPKLKRNDSQDQLKRIISEPYNFHHVTHTSSTQYHALDNASNVELVDEFSAIQASQMPAPALKGIRAQNLHADSVLTQNSNESVSDFDGPEPTSPLTMSPPVSPYESRSPGRVENFSRPVSRMNKPLPPSPGILPPPRVSSRQGHSEIPEPTSLAIDELLGVNSRLTIADYEYPQLENHSFRKVSSLEQIDLAGMIQTNIDHTMASGEYDGSDEDSKITTTALISSYLSDLEDVPEEDETKDTAHPVSRVSRQFSVRGKEKNLVINVTKNSPAANNGPFIIVQDPQLLIQEDLMSPTIPQFQPVLQDSPGSQVSNTRRRSSAGLVRFATAWDEDIDFCYEHEAEADCEFDWNRLSLEASRQPGSDIAVASSKIISDANKLAPHYLQPNATSVPATPDLDPGSAQSILTRSHEALTPLSDGAAQVDFFNATVPDHEYLKNLQAHDVENEAAYENFLAVGDDPDGQFQYYTQTTSHPVDIATSPRSSGSAISKCNSRESVMLSRAASIVRKHRSSTSTNSVPELVNSANSSRENTIRESVESLDHPSFAPLSENVRPGFSIHRPVKSLGSEVSTLAKLRSTGSNGSIHVVDLPYNLASSTHDRTKSTSALDHDDSHKFQQSASGLPFAARQSLTAQKRKSRAGYSLFPVVQ